MKPKIGLLPLYLELYDTTLPEMRIPLVAFYNTIADEFRKRGVDVVTSTVCRKEDEFKAAIRSFEEVHADCIVSLHLAYSPSLESAGAVAASDLPLIVLDTTPTYEFGAGQDPAEILNNHGIHGVQDFCNILVRMGKRFQIEAGHWKESDVLDRVARWIRSARVASSLRTAKIGLIGGQFRGMGDFQVPFEELKSALGMEVVQVDPTQIARLLPAADAPSVNAEMADNLSRFAAKGVTEAAHRENVRAGLATRRWIEENGLTGFTFNFMDIKGESGLPAIPFMEAGKAMSRGLGYAGEGDVLTAALVGALAGVYPETSFIEMFCPDWKGGAVFISHMGEMNVALTADKPVLMDQPMEMDLGWLDVATPVLPIGRFKPGKAVVVDLAPRGNGRFALIICLGEMLDAEGDDLMAGTVRGWLKPSIPLPDFLAGSSRAGGTHHSALVYGVEAEEIASFGDIMGWEVVVLAAK